MNHHFDDIKDKLGEPRWSDVEGFPRYCKFKPGVTSNIYAKLVCLVELGCQGCNIKNLDVAISWDAYSLFMKGVFKEIKERINQRREANGLEEFVFNEVSEEFFKQLTKEDWISLMRYGDPPNHDCVGDTMGTYVLRIKECWMQQDDIKSKDFMNWIRHPEYEIELETRD